ncbi:MAG: TVP38/TMEM64 family protein [Alphaproteobacteria bacterium]
MSGRRVWRVAFAALAVAMVLVAVAIVLAADWRAWWPEITAAHVEALIAAWGEWAAAASILLMVLHSFLPLPAEVIAIANGMLFGPLVGTAVTWTGAMLGAALSFALARHVGRPAVHLVVAERHWQRLEGWEPRIATLIALRLIPVISFNLINYGAGLAKVGWWPFLWTTGLGILPITIASVLAGDMMLHMRWWHLAGLAVAVVLCWWIALRLTGGALSAATSGRAPARNSRPPAGPP